MPGEGLPWFPWAVSEACLETKPQGPSPALSSPALATPRVQFCLFSEEEDRQPETLAVRLDTISAVREIKNVLKSL